MYLTSTTEDSGYDSMSYNEIKSLHEQISSFPDLNFDIRELISVTNVMIEELFGESFVGSEEAAIQLQDKVIMNDKFVQYMKYLMMKDIKQYTNYNVSVGVLFVIFCDYFDIDYNKSYLLLHHNIQNMIKKSLMNMIGKQQYNKYVNLTKEELGLGGYTVRKLI